jgi:hypothetical protein
MGVNVRKRIKGADRMVCEDVEWTKLALEKVIFRDSVIQ